MTAKRVILIVLDSLGIGALPDALKYGDAESNTLRHIAESVEGILLPNMEQLGLGKITDIPGLKSDLCAIGSFGKLEEKSAGKDTITGHWEMTGLIMDRPFPTYPNGFPNEVIVQFEKAIDKSILGNKPASGTKIIEEFGSLHMETGMPIVYTSADSVFQIAAHEEIIPIEKLYEYCIIARDILQGPHAVGRVIARPFTGEVSDFKRTSNRRDFSLRPVKNTVLDLLQEKRISVIGIGKIGDIFANQGISECIKTKDNMDGVNKTLEALDKYEQGLIFTNLVDFDQLYGHRNNSRGYAKALEKFDMRLSEIIAKLKKDDVLIITGDHGCDPTTKGTDHSREYIPVLIYGDAIQKNVDLGTRETFADIGATVAELLGSCLPHNGSSMVNSILVR